MPISTPPDTTTVDENTTTLQIWRVPLELKSQFKSRCGADKRTMRKVILEFLATYSSRP